jgi:hypothetical protein
MQKEHTSAFFLLCVLTLLFSTTFSFGQARSSRGAASRSRVNVTGRIELEGLARNAGRQSITLTFLNIEEPLQYEMQVTHAGQVHFHLPSGRYLVLARGTKWLGKRTEIDAVRPHNTFQLYLPGGDANGDNRVDWDDLDILANAFDSKPGRINWDERADLDCDDDVDDEDAEIMFYNLNRYGD